MRIITFILSTSICFSLFSQGNYDLLEGVAALERKEYKLARNKLSSSIEKNDWNPKSAYYRGIANYHLSKFEEAKTDFTAAAKEENSNTNLWLARVYAQELNSEMAILHLQHYLDHVGNYKINSIINDDSFKKITTGTEWKNFILGVEQTEQDELVLDMKFHLKNENYGKVIKLFNTQADDKKTQAMCQTVAQAYANDNLYELAIQELNQAIKMNPDNSALKIQVCSYLKKLKKYDNAIVNYTALIKDSPENLNLLYEIADCYYLNEDLDDAYEYINKYLGYFPQKENALILSSKINLQEGNYNKALQSINKIANTGKNNSQFYLTRGEIYYQTGSFKYSAADLSMYIDLNPNDALANYLLGNAQYKLKNNRLACYYWGRAVRFGNKEAIAQLQENCN